MTYDKAKKHIRTISKMDKDKEICFFTGKSKVENHHVISVWRLARFTASHPNITPEDYPIPLAPISSRHHTMIHQWQDENGHPNRVTEQDCLDMWIWKEQLKAKERDIIDKYFDNEWINRYTDEFKNQIEAIEDNLERYGFTVTEDYLKEVFIDEL